LGMQPKSGGKLRPRLNTGERPIANKYREGKMRRTLKRESKSACASVRVSKTRARSESEGVFRTLRREAFLWRAAPPTDPDIFGWIRVRAHL